MITYIEAQESDGGDDFIRIKVDGYTETEIKTVIDSVKDVMDGTICTLRKHYCHHDENKGCVVEDIPL